MDILNYIAPIPSILRRQSGKSKAIAAFFIFFRLFLSIIIGLAAATVLCFSAGCAPGSGSGGPPFTADILPPILLSAEVTDERSLHFGFDEEITIHGTSSVISDSLPVESALAEENHLEIRFAEDQGIGRSYILRAEVEDAKGNSLSFLYEFSGWNPRVPDLLINELNPRGSANTPDCIELYALSDGNLGGLVVLIGTPGNHSGSITLPTVEIAEGDFILVHPKSEGLPEEVDETDLPDASGGKLASDTAWDFWMPGSPGLPGNNGAVTLLARNGGRIIDAVLWSDREDDPDAENLGWTSAGFDFASDLGSSGCWKAESGGTPKPSDAVSVSSSTATRSLCRASNPEDTDSRNDWHTVPTSRRTFGAPNDDAVYTP